MRDALEARVQRSQDEDLRDVLQRCSVEMRRIENLHACAFSLSQWGDLLSQFLAYCPQSGGYSLGFTSAKLKDIAKAQGLLFGPCVYDDKTQRRLIDEVGEKVEAVIREVLPTTGVRGEAFAELVLPGLFSHFARVAPFIKHGSFAQEAEWRLVFAAPTIDGVPLDVRVGRSILVPYAEIDLSLDKSAHPFHEIIVGPCREPELAERAAALLTRVADCPSVTCRKGWGSYRAM
jgi:hypothetical protein